MHGSGRSTGLVVGRRWVPDPVRQRQRRRRQRHHHRHDDPHQLVHERRNRPQLRPRHPYNTSIEWAKSPDCGYLYTRKGQYPITATATWDAPFSGDYTGTDTATSQNTVNATIGEYQAIVTG